MVSGGEAGAVPGADWGGLIRPGFAAVLRLDVREINMALLQPPLKYGAQSLTNQFSDLFVLEGSEDASKSHYFSIDLRGDVVTFRLFWHGSSRGVHGYTFLRIGTVNRDSCKSNSRVHGNANQGDIP